MNKAEEQRTRTAQRRELLCSEIRIVFRSGRTPTQEHIDALLLALRAEAQAETDWLKARDEARG